MESDGRKRLLVRPGPHPYESFMGYILRLTELNDCDTPSWVTQEAGIGWVFRRRCAAGSHKAINLFALSKLADVEVTELESLRYPVDVQSGSNFQRLFFGLSVPQYVIRPKHPKVCPKCLLETAYIHKVWELALVTACPMHKCLLLDHCPGCGSRITWKRNKVSVCPCGYDWREYDSPLVIDSELQIARYVHQLCRLNFSCDYNDSPIHRVDLDNFVSALVFVASQFANTVYKKGKRLVDTKGKNFAIRSVNKEIHALLCATAAVFNNWPHNYFDFLEQRKSQSLNPRSVTGLGKDFAQYKIALYQSLHSAQLEFMRAAFQEYVTSKWDGGYVTQVKSLSRGVRERSRYISRKDAARILSMGVGGVDRLIAVGKLRAVVRDRNNFRSILIERTSLAPVKHALEHSLYLNQVIKLLGVTKQRIFELVESGLLIPLRGQDDQRSDWRFSDEDVRALLSNIEGKVLKKVPVGSGKTVSFFMALRALRRVNVGVGMFMKIILEDVIRPVGQSAGSGLASLIFLKSHISDYAKGLERTQIGETLGAPEAAKLLGINQNNARFLINKGLIQTHRQAIKGHCDLRVTRNAINLFNSDYVLPAKIARQLNISPGRLTNLIIACGINPASGPKVDGGMQYVFRRADIKDIDLLSLLSASSGKTVSRLNERKLVDTQRAAEFLDIHKSDVLDLAERGIITPHRHVPSEKHKDSGPFFSTYTIEKYKERTVNYDGLVSSKVTAEMLGVSGSTLNDRYVPKKLLQVALGGGRPGKRYFRLDEVKALIKSRSTLTQDCVTTAEAAVICKVSKNSIHEWTEAGLLHLVSCPRADGRRHNLYLRSDIEKLYSEREAFKIKCVSEGKSTRFGRPAGPNRHHVRNKVRSRIEQLVTQWGAKKQGQAISGQKLRCHLIKEGYRVGMNTIYECLRNLRQQSNTC